MIGEKFSPPLEDVLKELNKLEAELKVKGVRSGLVAGIRPIKADMKANAPKDSGDLAQSVGHSRLSKSAKARLGSVGGVALGEDTVALLVGPNRKVNGRRHGWKAQILEGGAKPHEITPKKADALRIKGGAVAKSVSHPGVQATRFMEKSLSDNESGFEGRFYKGLLRYLKRQGVSF